MGFDINDLMSKDTKVIRDVKKEKKQGRPKKEVTKNNIVTTYLTDQENDKLREKVKASGMSLAAYVRNVLLQGLNDA